MARKRVTKKKGIFARIKNLLNNFIKRKKGKSSKPPKPPEGYRRATDDEAGILAKQLKVDKDSWAWYVRKGLPDLSLGFELSPIGREWEAENLKVK